MFLASSMSDLLAPYSRALAAGVSSKKIGDWICSHIKSAAVLNFKTPLQGVVRHNAEVLFLDGPASSALSRIKHCPQLRLVLLRLSPSLLRLNCLIGFFSYIPRKKLSFGGVYQGGGATWLALIPARFKRSKDSPTLYMPEQWTINDFVQKLEQRGCAYSQLENETSFLVSDEDRLKVQDLLNEQIGTKPVSVYSCSGETGRYLPSVARSILSRAQKDAAGRSLPCDEDAFLIEAYNALYLKGDSAALAQLKAQAARLGISAEYTESYKGIAKLIETRGWQPARDTLNMYGRSNPLVKEIYFSHRHEEHLPPGLCVFLIREAAEKWGVADWIRTEVEKKGFQVLEKYTIPPEKRAEISYRIRGGNWGRGTWPAPGGLPAVVLVLADPCPSKPGFFQKRSTPSIDNTKILCKHSLRDHLNDLRPVQERANCLHTSDNTAESLDYLETIFPEEHKDKLYASFLSLLEQKV